VRWRARKAGSKIAFFSSLRRDTRVFLVPDVIAISVSRTDAARLASAARVAKAFAAYFYGSIIAAHLLGIGLPSSPRSKREQEKERNDDGVDSILRLPCGHHGANECEGKSGGSLKATPDRHDSLFEGGVSKEGRNVDLGLLL